MSAWQPIETAPKDGTPVLIWDTLNREHSIAHFVVGGGAFTGWFHINDWTGGARFDHWQPLPPKPGAAS